MEGRVTEEEGKTHVLGAHAQSKRKGLMLIFVDLISFCFDQY